MKVLVLLICVGLTLAARRSYERYLMEHAEDYFEEFIITYNKNYNDQAEKQMRFEIFKENLEIINEMNSDSYDTVYGITIFADLTYEEFLDMYTGLDGFETLNCERKIWESASSEAPESFDWRDHQKVSRVKNQLACGSCWSFGATGNLESQYAIKYNTLLEFSEQQLVDCDTRSSGCNGTANLENPFLYWMDTMGAMLEQDYPYTSFDGKCESKTSKVKVNVTGCIVYHPESEDELRDLISETGPLTIGLDASPFRFYHNGVFRNCSTNININHAVLLVGYGTDEGTPYWLIKNSWGEHFGETGYIKLPRGVNACGIMIPGMISAVIA